MRGVGATIYVLGLVSGLLVAMIWHELSPASRDLVQYRAVRDFAREAFVRDVADEELLDNALHGMLGELDPYSRFYDAEESEALERETRGRFRGIGVIFRAPVAAGQVLYPLAGSPADRAGVRVGDTFVEVEGRSVQEMGEAEFRATLGNPEGRVLEARLRGLAGDERKVAITPASIVDPSVRHVRVLDAARGIGYLAITSFSHETPGEFDRAVAFLHERGARALILDLRHNFGGVLEAAVVVAGRFLRDGTIVSTEGRGDPVIYRADLQGAWYADTPLVILVDGDTASASEVVAGALQDHRVAVLVGEATYGKGMVQTIRSFERFGTRAKVTSSYYYSPTHRNFERSAEPGRDYGILPDVEILLDAGERARVHAHLASYSPGPEAIPLLEAWERAEGVPLVGAQPDDPHLVAALELLLGRRPAPARIER